MEQSVIWAVVMTGGDFGVRALRSDELLPPDMIAAHPTEASARAGLERAEAMHMAMQAQIAPMAEREQAFRHRVESLAAGEVLAGGSLLHHCNLVNRCIPALIAAAQPRHSG